VDFTDLTHQAEHTRTAAEQREADVCVCVRARRVSRSAVPLVRRANRRPAPNLPGRPRRLESWAHLSNREWLATRRCRLAGCWPAPVTLRPTVTAVPAPVGIANALLPPKSDSLASKATRGVVTACHQAATERHSRSTGGANPRRKYSAICRDGALV
jgi:hypothetical protein